MFLGELKQNWRWGINVRAVVDGRLRHEGGAGVSLGQEVSTSTMPPISPFPTYGVLRPLLFGCCNSVPIPRCDWGTEDLAGMASRVMALEHYARAQEMAVCVSNLHNFGGLRLREKKTALKLSLRTRDKCHLENPTLQNFRHGVILTQKR